jgi:hypothetical protein
MLDVKQMLPQAKQQRLVLGADADASSTSGVGTVALAPPVVVAADVKLGDPQVPTKHENTEVASVASQVSVPDVSIADKQVLRYNANPGGNQTAEIGAVVLERPRFRSRGQRRVRERAGGRPSGTRPHSRDPQHRLRTHTRDRGGASTSGCCSMFAICARRSSVTQTGG